MTKRADYLTDLIAELPEDAMDAEYLTTRVFPKLNTRALAALLDAFQLMRRDGRLALKEVQPAHWSTLDDVVRK